MSDLRDQLRRTSDAYARQRYPGDLAADVLGQAADRLATPPPRAKWPLWAGGLAAVVALAAAVAVALRPAGVDRPETTPAVAAVAPADEPAAAADTVLSVETAPTLWNTFEPAPSLFAFGDGAADSDPSAAVAAASVPTFPTLDELAETGSTITLSEEAQ